MQGLMLHILEIVSIISAPLGYRFAIVTKTTVFFLLKTGNQVCISGLCFCLATFSCYLRLYFPVKFSIWSPENGGFWSLNPSSLTEFLGIYKSHTWVSPHSFQQTTPLPPSVTRFHGIRCCGNQDKCVFWELDPKFITSSTVIWSCYFSSF